MELLQGNIKKLYLRYLAASFGSAFITSVYGVVDMAMVGHYQGPEGVAALAVVAPLWNLIYSLGLLSGIGGAVLFSRSSAKGSSDANEYYTTALIMAAASALLCWAALVFFEVPLLRAFGAEGEVLTLARRYLLSVKFAAPAFLAVQFLSAFLRNDSAPGLATKAVVAGGVFNVFGDYFFIFTLDMGLFGAGLATALGAVVSLAVMLLHFRSRARTLRIVVPRCFFRRARLIFVTGFSTFFLDIAMGLLTMIFNRQIMAYLGVNALAVYGVIVNISTFVQCCGYGIGQASQPILSANFGAGLKARVKELFRYNMISVAAFSVLWFAAVTLWPSMFIALFMKPTPAVSAIAPEILRRYALSFLLLPFNIYAVYYFQSMMRPVTAFIISVSRGIAVSGAFLLAFPFMFGASALWFAMPATEAVVAAFSVWALAHVKKG